MKISEIKDKIIQEKELKDETLIRFFYQGREMKDENYLGTYSYQSGMVIQAMIRWILLYKHHFSFIWANFSVFL